MIILTSQLSYITGIKPWERNGAHHKQQQQWEQHMYIIITEREREEWMEQSQQGDERERELQ